MDSLSSKKPLVSIVLPTYNRVNFLTETIRNILAQTYSEFELIVIDDCSTDQTHGVIMKLAKEDSRIKYLHNEVNMKIVRTLNKGLRAAQGIYIARADDDDPWIDLKKLEKQVSFMEKNEKCVIIGTGAIAVDENGSELFRYLQPGNDAEIRSVILLNNPFIHGTVVFRKSILEKIGYYDEKSQDVEDWDLWMRMGQYGEMHNLPEFCINRFYGPRGISIKNRRRMSHSRLLLIKKYRKNYAHFSMALIFNTLQRMYSFLPYVTVVDNFLFKVKRKFGER